MKKYLSKMNLALFALFLISGCASLFTAKDEKPLAAVCFNFEKATGRECCDATGKIRCVSGNEVFRTEGGALRTHGRSDIKIPDTRLFPANPHEVTLCAWVFPCVIGSYQTVLFKGNRKDKPQKIQFCLSLKDGNPEFKYMDIDGTWKGIMMAGKVYKNKLDIAPIPISKWSHLAATFNNGKSKLFVNGKLVGEFDELQGDQLVINAAPMLVGVGQTFGKDKPGYSFDGLVNDIGIFDKALSIEQLKSIYECQTIKYANIKITSKEVIPAGYDPKFKNKLPITAEYEKNNPKTTIMEKNCRAKIAPYQGAPSLYVNDKVIYPMMFMPSITEDTRQTFNSSHDFAAAGVTLFSDVIATNLAGPCNTWWKGVGDYDFKQIDDRIKTTIRANPDARILIRLKLDPPSRWWQKDHPGQTPVFFRDGKYEEHKGWTSLASKDWETLYSKMLRDFVDHVESSDYAAHVAGYLPAGGYSSEWWYHGQDNGLIDYSPVAQTRFQEFVKQKYHMIATINAAWGKDFKDFSEASIPTPAARMKGQIGIFHNPATDQACIDYFLFLNDITERNMLNCARIIKEATRGAKLVGYFHGYLPLGNLTISGMLNNGHCTLGKVVSSPDIDFFCTPTDYVERGPGEPGFHIGNFNGTYFLNNKLFWDEADLRTHFHQNRGEFGATESLKETLTVMQRAFGYTLTKGNAIWWFALAGDAYFHEQAIMEEVAKFQKIGEKSMTFSKKPVSEVAFVMDEASIGYLSYQESPLITELIRGTYTCTTKLGAPCDMYLTTDLKNPDMPDYKVYVFPNLFYADAETRAAIERKVRKNNAVAVWLYAPGLISEKGIDTEGMKALTGMSFKMTNKATDLRMGVVSADGPIGQTKSGFDVYHKISPCFEVTDPEARIVGMVDGKPALAMKEFGSWRSIYSLTPLTVELLREICDYAGVHVYSRTNDAFSANSSFVMLHTSSAGDKEIKLPGKYKVTELLSGEKIGDSVSVINETLPAQTTKIYQLEK